MRRGAFLAAWLSFFALGHAQSTNSTVIMAAAAPSGDAPSLSPESSVSASTVAAGELAAGLPASFRAVVARERRCAIETFPTPVPRGREVLIRVFGTSVNRIDTLQRAGSYPPPPGESEILGVEMAGEVVQVGPACERSSDVAVVGARVMALVGSGGYGEFALVDERQLLRVPDSMDWTTAASIPEVWLTALTLLHVVGQVNPGEWVLVHAAGSGVGLAAIQLARVMGAKPIAVAGSDEKLRVAEAMGAVAGVNYKTDSDWEKAVLRVTGPGGVHVILDCVAASFWRKNAEVIAMEGRWVLYGTLGGVDVDGPLLGAILRKRVRLEGSTIRTRSIPFKERVSALFAAEYLPRFESGELKSHIDRVFKGLEAAQEAHEVLESNANTGKVVLRVRA